MKDKLSRHPEGCLSSLGETAVTPVRFVKVLPRANGDNTRRVNSLMTAEIVMANMIKINRFRDAWHLINIAQKTIQVQIIADTVFIAFEMCNVDRIKADKRCPQANIRFCQPIARQIAMLTEDLLQPGKMGKDILNGVIIGLLAGRKTGLVNAIVNVVINPAVQLVDFIAQFSGIIVPGFCAQCIKCCIEHANDFSGFIADNRMIFLSHSTGTVTRPL